MTSSPMQVTVTLTAMLAEQTHKGRQAGLLHNFNNNSSTTDYSVFLQPSLHLNPTITELAIQSITVLGPHYCSNCSVIR